ncbi:MAG: murein hydrolase activator EnvC family protein [Bacillota bacterium]
MKKAVLFIVALSLILSVFIPVFGDNITDAQKQKNYIDSKINDINKQKKNEQKKLKTVKNEKEYLEAVQKQESKEYRELVQKVSSLNEDLEKIDQAIKESEERYDEQLDLFKVRLKTMYENSSFTYLDTLAESKSIVDFLGRLELIAAISKRDKELIESLKEAKNEIEYKRELVAEEKENIQQKANESLRNINNLKETKATLDLQIRSINSKLYRLEEQEDALIKKSQELGNQIRSLQRKGAYAGGSMIWPVPSSTRVSSYFGNRLHPILKRYKMHTGIDISAKSGASIVAANKGTVIMTGWQGGYGYTVVIDHGGGITTLYAHCSKIIAKKNDVVKAGETIAKIGSTGLSTGPHLHFEVRKNGSPTNPLNYVKP